jgi:D-serine deaminase-like pyridoxal phosphate-dependent protein
VTTERAGSPGVHPGAVIDDVDTPALIVDLERMASNIEAMARLGRDGDLALRPHMKSHKIPELAVLQMEAGAVGITCQKLGEAEVMAAAGLRDITIAYPIIGERKVRRLVDLAHRVRITTLVDSIEGAQPLSEAAAADGITLDTLVEVDDGYHRCGVPPEHALPIARTVAFELPGLRFVGILAYEGQIYDLTDQSAVLATARRSYDVMGEVAERLRGASIPVERVSVGASATARAAADHPAVTELRPGSYIFQDRYQVSMGAASVEECALSVLATVVSVPAADRAIIDVGSKGLSWSPPVGTDGYGLILGHEEAAIDRLADEHGILSVPEGARPFSIGERVRVIPNSHPPVVNAFSELIGYRVNRIDVVWPIAARGRMQ